MPRSTHFIGLPPYAQIVQPIDRTEVLRISQSLDGERYVRRFNAWTHLIMMLYAVVERFDSLREITTSLQSETHRLNHLGVKTMPTKNTLADVNKRRSEAIFEATYRGLYAKSQSYLSSGSRNHHGRNSAWMKHLQIIDSTTISLFSSLVFKGVGGYPKIGKRKGSVRVHTVIHVNKDVPSDVRFISVAADDSFMLQPASFSEGDTIAMDRTYISYRRFEEPAQRGMICVTKMEKNLVYTISKDVICQSPEGAVLVRE